MNTPTLGRGTGSTVKPVFGSLACTMVAVLQAISIAADFVWQPSIESRTHNLMVMAIFLGIKALPLLPVLILIANHRVRAANETGFIWPQWRWWVYAVPLAIAAVEWGILTSPLARILSPPTGHQPCLQQRMIIQPNLAFAVLLYAGVGPVAEELVFRRVVLGTLMMRFQPLAAIALSAVVFGAAHTFMHGLGTGVEVLGLGVATGVAYHRTRSVLASWAIHAVYNGYALYQMLSGPC